MKKVLFLSFNYPYGEFGPSTNSTVRIMKSLSDIGKYEIHCCSYLPENKKNYEDIPNIKLHHIKSKNPSKKGKSRFSTFLKLFLTIPFYPFGDLFNYYSHYKACKEILKSEKYDLVIAQCFSKQSLFSGVMLKKHGYTKKMMVIFWDNIYGLMPKYLPKNFVLRRQRKAESWVAKYTDLLISLYPIKQFHQEYGEIPNAIGKREYLGIPAIIRPDKKEDTPYKKFIIDDKINILYSGTLYDIQHINYLINLLNATNIAERINIILLTKGISKEKEEELKNKFNGSIQFSGWIPLSDLMNLYHFVDFFLSFPGKPTAICSKVYEYMSYGKPLILFYDNDKDVNTETFSQYPLCLSIDVRRNISDNTILLEQYITRNNGNIVPFEETEKLYKADSPSAYVELINNLLK